MKICSVCSTEYPDDVRFCPNDGQTLRSAAPATDLVGQVVADRYHVVKKLGEGGMGHEASNASRVAISQSARRGGTTAPLYSALLGQCPS